MPLSPRQLDVRFPGNPFGFSARRIYEHFSLGQINAFVRSASSIETIDDAAAVVDIIHFCNHDEYLTGLTVSSLQDANSAKAVLGDAYRQVRQLAKHDSLSILLYSVLTSAIEFSNRRAIRSAHGSFLPVGDEDNPFRVKYLRSRLVEYLRGQTATKAPARQWTATFKNLATQCLRQEELHRSGLPALLEDKSSDPRPISAAQLQSTINFSELRLSVIPNIVEARSQLQFSPATERVVPKVKGEAKPQFGQLRQLRFFDRVLGYRIEQIEHPTLWGSDRHWQAVTFRGQVLRNRETRRAIFDSAEQAMQRAQEHAREVLPKILASERWVGWSWTGGKDYREWLITLPFCRGSFYSSHFAVRNLLSHVRCDLREGAEGESILLVHEIQSDWMQTIRRAIQDDGKNAVSAAMTPWLNEWPALTLKLVLLHAASTGADAIGWTRGSHQVQRYDGLGRQGLMTLYDRTLPQACNHFLKPFGRSCGIVDVYVPENFRIQRVELGYEVRNSDNMLLGIAPTFAETRKLFPDGAHERLHSVHGVSLPKDFRAALLDKGLMAWG